MRGKETGLVAFALGLAPSEVSFLQYSKVPHGLQHDADRCLPWVSIKLQVD